MDVLTTRKLTITGGLITLTGAIFFSTKAVIVKYAFWKSDIDAVSLLALRMFFSLPFYLVAAWIAGKKSGGRPLTQKQWLSVIMLGVFGYYLSSLFDFLGLKFISAGLERLILFLYPTFAVLINAAVFKEKIEKKQGIALVLTYAGIVLAYLGELSMDAGNPDFFIGSLLIFICSITFAIYLVGSGKLIPQVGVTRFTAYVMLASTAGVFVHFMINNNYSIFHSGNPELLYGIMLAVIATVIPSFLIAAGMKQIGANNVAIISSIGPVSTILQAHFILNEPIYTAQIAGTLLVVSGVVLIGWKNAAGKE